MPENISSQFHRLYPAPIEDNRVVETILERDSIPGNVRWEGMHVYVSQGGEQKTYELRGGITNDFWEPISDIDIDVAVDIAFSETSTNPVQNQVITNGMYQRTQLQTSGQAQVHWDNLTNVPDLVEESELSNYQLRSEKGQPNGYASLNASGVIPSSELPPLAITHTFVVASQSEMLALDAQTGDIAVRTDLNNSFILQSEPASSLGNWVELLTPGAPVQSVNGETGTVQLDPSFSGGQLSITGSSSVNLDSRYYTETELQTSGQAQVHWDNLTNVPDLVEQSDLNDYQLLSEKATDFSTINNTLYPTTQAVADYVLSEKPPAAVPVRKNAGVLSQVLMDGETLDINETANLHYSSSASGYPTAAGGALFSSSRGNNVTFQIAGSITQNDEMFFRFGNNNGFQPWHQVASREWVNSQGFLTSTPSLQEVTGEGATTTVNTSFSGGLSAAGTVQLNGVSILGTTIAGLGSNINLGGANEIEVTNPIKSPPAQENDQALTAGNLGFGLSWNSSTNEVDWGTTSDQGSYTLYNVDIPIDSLFGIGDVIGQTTPYFMIGNNGSNTGFEISNTNGSYFLMNELETSMSLRNILNDRKKIEMSGSPGIIITDSASDMGLLGSDDFSANYTNNSYVQKTYVDQAEYLKSLPNYNATVEQVLGHDVSGNLTWINN